MQSTTGKRSFEDPGSNCERHGHAASAVQVARERWLAGFAVGVNASGDTYAHNENGAGVVVETAKTALYPYGRVPDHPDQRPAPHWAIDPLGFVVALARHGELETVPVVMKANEQRSARDAGPLAGDCLDREPPAVAGDRARASREGRRGAAGGAPRGGGSGDDFARRSGHAHRARCGLERRGPGARAGNEEALPGRMR